MRRIATLFVALTMLIGAFSVSVSAQTPLSVKYVPKTQRGTMFYLDLFSELPIGAAVFDISYDDDVAEFRGVYCDSADAAAEAHAENSVIGLAYSNRKPSSGKLFRLSFIALKSGTINFAVTVTQAVDSELSYLSDIPACQLSVKLGKEDIPVSSANSAKASGKTTSKKSYSGSKSNITVSSGDGDNKAADSAEAEGISLDLSGQNKTTFFLLGGAAAFLVCLLIVAAYFLGKRRREKIPQEEEIPAAQDEDTGDNAHE